MEKTRFKIDVAWYSYEEMRALLCSYLIKVVDLASVACACR